MRTNDDGPTKVGANLRFNDAGDGDFFVETPQVRAVLDQLHAVLELSRQDDVTWRPHVCLVGPEGSGKTAVATQFMLAAQRAVSCALTAHLNDDLRRMMEARRLGPPEVVERREADCGPTGPVSMRPPATRMPAWPTAHPRAGSQRECCGANSRSS